MSKKAFATIGMIVSIVLIFMGILVFGGSLGGEAETAGYAPSSYDSGYAVFGGDYYTYVVNNTGETATASRQVARNLVKLCDLLRNVFGILFISFGLFGLCGFGILRQSCKIPKEQIGVTAEQRDANRNTTIMDDLPDL